MSDSKRKSFKDLVSESEVPVLVDVYSETCGPCHMLKPVLKELKNNMGEDLKIIKINGPKNIPFMQNWAIEAFPTLILFDKGEVVWRHMGFTPLPHLERMVRDAVPV